MHFVVVWITLYETLFVDKQSISRYKHNMKEDVKKFSHALRDFRNYIHPYQQMSIGFQPDEHTARICFQVLKAALYQIEQKSKS